MKLLRKTGDFLLSLLIHLILDPWELIPAGILLALHFLLDWWIGWFWIALGLWVLRILLLRIIFGWANRCGNAPDRPKENKNPYSVKKTNIPSKTNPTDI